MAKILFSPGKYIQGPGEIKNLGSYAAALGKKALILISAGGKKRSGENVLSGFENVDCTAEFEIFHGECSYNEIHRIEKIVKEKECDLVIGIGGGKIFDTAKAVAYYQKTPVIICPTIASTDAPCSALSVIYSDAGVFEEYLFLPSNPNIVLLDTEIIAKSPVRLTMAGIGDALATYFEARACERTDAPSLENGGITRSAMALCKLCYETLREYGAAAKKACECQVVTPALDAIIEANVYLSGVGADNGGLAVAHSFYNGLTALGGHSAPHGNCVALGTLVQLVIEGASKEEFREVQDFCMEVGLPVTLAEIGVNTDEEIRIIAEKSCVEGESIHNMVADVTVDQLYAAIVAADALGRERLAEK